jgi:uncharacterized protein (TIGR03067 family)
MTVRVFVSIACVLLVADDAAKEDLKKLQGEWVLESFKKEGEDLPAKGIKATSMIVKGEAWLYKSDLGDWSVTFKIDPSRTPKTIDMTIGTGDEARLQRGIYKIEGDTLTICRAAGRGGEERPKAFPGDHKGLVLIVWKRAKE